MRLRPAALRDAVEKAQGAYFAGPFKALRDGVVKDLLAGNKSSEPFADWRTAVEPALSSVADTRPASPSRACPRRPPAAKPRRGTTAIVYGIILILSLVLAGVGLLVVVGRVAPALSRLTGIMLSASPAAI